jgi:hypothetical protein
MQLVQPNLENSLLMAKESLPASLIPRMVPAWTGQVIQLGAIPRPRPLIFFGRWGDTDSDGRSIHPPAAHIAFHTTESLSRRRLCLRVAPAAKKDLHCTFAINGEALVVERLQSADTRVVELPLAKVTSARDVVLTILPGFESARTAKNEKPALTLQSLWLADRCF